MDLPTIVLQLSDYDILAIEEHLHFFIRPGSACGQHQEILFDPQFTMIVQSHQRGQPGLANEFIKQWITKHQNPTWEALVALLEGLGVYGAAQRIRTIIPTVSPPASEHAASKKK